MSKIPVTTKVYEKLQEELKLLKGKRLKIIEAISQARDQGDLSENAEYQEAKNDQGLNEARISALEGKLAMAEIVNVSGLSGDTVKFGAFVTIENQDDKSIITYQIVSDYESDAVNKRLSISSPLAHALIGKKIEDYTEVTLPAGEKLFKILKIEFK